jgi:hypothetical protein
MNWELGRPYRPPPDLMLDVRKKLEPGLILNQQNGW